MRTLQDGVDWLADRSEAQMKYTPATPEEIEAAASIAVRLPHDDVGRYLTEYVMFHRVQADVARLVEAISKQRCARIKAQLRPFPRVPPMGMYILDARDRN